MRSLLSADFARLWKSKTFWISCAFLVLFSAGSVLTSWHREQAYGYITRLESGLFTFTLLLGLITAVLCSLLLGPEHSGGFRNKAVSGHARPAVYLSALLTCSAASLILCAAAILPRLLLGIPLLGGFTLSAPIVAAALLGACLLALAWASVFTLLAVLISNRFVAPTVSMVLALVLLIAGLYLNGRLEAPPTIQGYQLSVNGELVEAEPAPNPDYLPEGLEREAYQFLADFLPDGQAYQYASLNLQRMPQKVGCSVLLFALAGTAGLLLFRRKDMK